MDMSTSIDHHIVIPGDEIPEIQENAAANKKIILGNGIRFVYINFMNLFTAFPWTFPGTKS